MAVRGQWRIENSLHRVLDVTFREDWNCNGFAPVPGRRRHVPPDRTPGVRQSIDDYVVRTEVGRRIVVIFDGDHAETLRRASEG